MPYELSFTASVQPGHPEIYINDCCWGGDAIRDRLLPLISNRYGEVVTEQEDWGWWLFVDRILDTTELDELRQSVVADLSQWVGSVDCERVAD